MFMGEYQHNVDLKGRLIIPSKFREQLGDRVVVTKGLDGCLYLYSTEAWEAFLGKFGSMNLLSPEDRKLKRYFVAGASECEFDKQGRIIIPQELKNYAGIEKELVTMGAMSKIEVWSRDVWDAPNNESKMENEDFARALAEYNF